MHVHLPDPFVQNIRQILDKDAEACLSAITSGETCTSIRLNPEKQIPVFPGGEQVPWYSGGRYLAQRPSFIADPLFHAGAYYVQEASSMFVGHVLKHLRQQITGTLRVLDLCAAPGGKTTAMLDELSNEDLLVSNEIIKSRVNILQENVIRWGRNNTVVTHNDPERIGSIGAFFDVILIDAPCSGEGMFRKDQQVVEEWSSQHVQHCAQRQQRILSDALPALKPGGYLIYSTCTFNRDENEKNVQWLINQQGYQPVNIPVNPGWGIVEETTYDNTAMCAYRFYPHKIKGEGFFLACLQKPGTEVETPRRKTPSIDKPSSVEDAIIRNWLKTPEAFTLLKIGSMISFLRKEHLEDVQYLRSKLTIRHFGTNAGEVIREKFIPDHQLALSIHLKAGTPVIETNTRQALTFLKKETFDPGAYQPGIYQVAYQGLGLGWVKLMPNRMNNYLPANWRILKDLGDLI